MITLAALVALSLTTTVRPPLAQAPGQAWDARFFLGGLAGGGSALATFDDGSGPALYVGGGFTAVDDVAVNNIARWDGRRFESLAGGLTTTSALGVTVMCMAVFDDGTGAELYVGGRFTRAGTVNTSGIAKWNGTRWAAVGNSTNPVGTEVRTLAIFDDGSGPALYAGGHFPTFAGLTTNSVARWNGSAWAPVGGGFGSIHSVGSGEVEALAVFQGKLYAGGEFASADGLPARNLARWDGAKWRALGSGAVQEFGSTASVYALEVCDDGSGEFLVLGGDFDQLDGKTARSIGRFDGEAFAPIGAGLPWGSVHSLAQHDDGNGSALYVGGVFFLPDGGPRVSSARWDGRAWALVGDDLTVDEGTSPVVDLESFDAGGGKTLFAVGGFGFSGERVVRGLAELREGAWRSPSERGHGIEVNINSSGTVPVSALEVWDDGMGAALYAAGNFIAAGTRAAKRIARWDGEAWTSLGSGAEGSFTCRVLALGVFDDGIGSALYAGGDFTSIGAQPIAAIARWDGVAWWPLGTGIAMDPNLGFAPVVRALEVFDDGSGAALFVGGSFNVAGGTPVNGLARWDGTSWSDVGGGVTGGVACMAIFDDGSGPALYVGGSFLEAGGVGANSLARWDGTSWSDVGGGFNPSSSTVMALQAFDDGTGPALYAGGQFSTAGGATAHNLARWDGSAWSVVGSGLTSSVSALEVHDDGAGPRLYVGGEFTRSIAGQVLLRIARWDGASWSTLDSGIDGISPSVHALKSFPLDGVPALFAGGKFSATGGRKALDVARWSDSRRRRAR